MTAVAAAAGCNVWTSSFDDGVDMLLEHKRPGQKECRIQLQLKATSSEKMITSTSVSAYMSEKRWDEFRDPDPYEPRIVVVMALPDDQGEWAFATHDAFELRHCAYWVNIAGEPAASSSRPIVTAPRANVFDDVAVCKMMAKIRAGGAP
nr:DUF4365 domain-containing protein [Demequina gelatinilytica]